MAPLGGGEQLAICGQLVPDDSAHLPQALNQTTVSTAAVRTHTQPLIKSTSFPRMLRSLSSLRMRYSGSTGIGRERVTDPSKRAPPGPRPRTHAIRKRSTLN